MAQIKPAHLVKFKKYVEHWQRVLGLNDWEIGLHDDFADNKTTRAEVSCDCVQRTACIEVGATLGEDPLTNENISKAALHECGHVLMAEFELLCKDKNATDDMRLSAEHRIVNTLVPLLFAKYHTNDLSLKARRSSP